MNLGVNLNALHKNALYYAQSADILSKEILRRLNDKDFKKFEQEDVGLLIPIVTLNSFSCELFLKLILLIENNEVIVKDHNLKNLFNKISTEIQNNILDLIADKNKDFNIDKFYQYLDEISLLFVESRYIHETCELTISYEFLIEFRDVITEICTMLIDN